MTDGQPAKEFRRHQSALNQCQVGLWVLVHPCANEESAGDEPMRSSAGMSDFHETPGGLHRLGAFRHPASLGYRWKDDLPDLQAGRRERLLVGGKTLAPVQAPKRAMTRQAGMNEDSVDKGASGTLDQPWEGGQEIGRPGTQVDEDLVLLRAHDEGQADWSVLECSVLKVRRPELHEKIMTPI